MDRLDSDHNNHPRLCLLGSGHARPANRFFVDQRRCAFLRVAAEARLVRESAASRAAAMIDIPGLEGLRARRASPLLESRIAPRTPANRRRDWRRGPLFQALAVAGCAPGFNGKQGLANPRAIEQQYPTRGVNNVAGTWLQRMC